MKLNKISVLIFALVLLLIPNIYANQNYDIINLDADVYNYNPTPVVSGEDFEIWIQLTNKSNTPAENIEYFLETEYPFILISDNQGKINRLDAYQSKIIKYKIRTNQDTITGTYDLELRYKRDGVSIYNIKKYLIDVKGQNAIIDVVSSTLENVTVGKDTEIKLNLKNLGKKNAKDIFITVNDSEDKAIKIIGLKTQYIDKIEVEEEKEVTIKVNVSKDITYSSYTLPITINYSDIDRDYEIIRNVGIKIEDNPEMVLSVKDIGNNFKIKPNTTESISVEVYNIGNVDTEISYVTIQGEHINNTKEFIGSIEKNNYDTLEINFNTIDIKEKETTITVNLHYKDNNLKEQIITQDFKVKIDTEANGESANRIIMSIFGIIGFIIGLAIFILLLRWLIKILIKPAYKTIINIFKRK